MSIVRGSSLTRRANAGPAGNEGTSRHPLGQTSAPTSADVETLFAFAGQLHGLARYSRAEQVKSMAHRLREWINVAEGVSVFTVAPIFTVNDAARLLTWRRYSPNLADAVQRIAAKFWTLATDGDVLPAGMAEGR